MMVLPIFMLSNLSRLAQDIKLLKYIIMFAISSCIQNIIEILAQLWLRISREVSRLQGFIALSFRRIVNKLQCENTFLDLTLPNRLGLLRTKGIIAAVMADIEKFPEFLIRHRQRVNTRIYAGRPKSTSWFRSFYSWNVARRFKFWPQKSFSRARPTLGSAVM